MITGDISLARRVTNVAMLSLTGLAKKVPALHGFEVHHEDPDSPQQSGRVSHFHFKGRNVDHKPDFDRMDGT